MHYNYDFMTAIQQLYQYLETQQRKLTELELRIVELQDGLDGMKRENSGKVERIEYKFDQLKVERLEGTLNIGITPTGGVEPTAIEDFSINKNTIDVPIASQHDPILFESIKNAIYQYLNRDCFQVMAAYEQQYNYPLDTSYRNFIIDDVRKQIDSRIQYYLRGTNVTERNEETLKEIEEVTINNVINDINRTIEQFIKHLPQKGES